MSTPLSVDVAPEQRLAEMTWQRDGLIRAAAENRQAAAQREHELQVMISQGELDPSYDVENDHRIALLLNGAQTWAREAQALTQRIEEARDAWGRLVEPVEGPVRSRVRRAVQRPKGEE